MLRRVSKTHGISNQLYRFLLEMCQSLAYPYSFECGSSEKARISKMESICTTGVKGVYGQDRGSPKSVVFKVLQNLGVGKNIWDQSYFCVAACCWKCRSLQSASAILGTPIFFCFSCLPTVLSSCSVCCNKFKVLNA